MPKKLSLYKKFLWIMAFVSSLALTQMAFADPSICKEKLSKMVQSLDLDDAQKAKIKPILAELKSSLQAAKAQMEGLRDKIAQQVNSAHMDQNIVNSLVDKKTKLIGDMIKAKIIAKNQIFAILNSVQKEKLQNMMRTAEEKIAAAYKKCGED
jgi:protein CpxP